MCSTVSSSRTAAARGARSWAPVRWCRPCWVLLWGTRVARGGEYARSDFSHMEKAKSPSGAHIAITHRACAQHSAERGARGAGSECGRVRTWGVSGESVKNGFRECPARGLAVARAAATKAPAHFSSSAKFCWAVAAAVRALARTLRYFISIRFALSRRGSLARTFFDHLSLSLSLSKITPGARGGTR